MGEEPRTARAPELYGGIPATEISACSQHRPSSAPPGRERVPTSRYGWVEGGAGGVGRGGRQ